MNCKESFSYADRSVFVRVRPWFVFARVRPCSSVVRVCPCSSVFVRGSCLSVFVRGSVADFAQFVAPCWNTGRYRIPDNRGNRGSLSMTITVLLALFNALVQSAATQNPGAPTFKVVGYYADWTAER